MPPRTATCQRPGGHEQARLLGRPCESLHAAGLSPDQEAAWTSEYEAGAKLETAGQPAAALDRYAAAAGIDDQYADLAFRTNPQHAGIVLTQDPHEGARIDPEQGVELVVGLPAKPVPPRLVLDLVTLDARFKAVRLTGQPLSARAQQLGLRDRRSLTEFVGAEDAKVRDALGMPALRDAQIVKRILRDLLAKTE